MPTVKRGKKRQNIKQISGEVNRIVTRIQSLQVKCLTSFSNALRWYVQVGVELSLAKKKIPPGQWQNVLDQLPMNVRQAQRLMQLSMSPLATRIRTNGTHLGYACSADLQKLLSLARLPEELVDEGLEKVDLNMSRKQVAEQVESLMNGPNSDSDPETAEHEDAEYEDQSDEHSGEQNAANATDGQTDDESDDDQADDYAENADEVDEDAASDSNAESSEQTSDDDEQQAGEGHDDEEGEEADEQDSWDPLWHLVGVAEQVADELVESAVDAIQSAMYEAESLGDVAVAMKACRRHLGRVLQAVEAQLATVEESP